MSAYIRTILNVRKCISVKRKKQYVGPVIGAAGLAFLFLIIGLTKVSFEQMDTQEKKQVSMKGAFDRYIAEVMEDGVWRTFMPVYSFTKKNGEHALLRMVYGRLEKVVPLLYLESDSKETLDSGYEEVTMSTILKEEAQEENRLEEEALADLLLAENQTARGQLEAQRQQETIPMQNQDKSKAETTFVPHHVKLAQVDLEAFDDYDTLLKNFYTVDKSTMAEKELLDVEKLSTADMTISKEAEGPQILIYHTHSQEAFADSVPGDRKTTIVGVGERLAQVLTEDYGYKVLHHQGVYDLPSRDDAYSAALPEIEKLLEENPQIQVVIDLHRDAMDESTRLVTDMDGRPTARFMFFNGLSRTKKTGNISYLYNKNLEGNLAFSFQMQKAAVEYYPGLTRKIYLKAYRYNMHLRPRNLLIELGAQNNTVEEAMNAVEPLAHILDMVLSGQR